MKRFYHPEQLEVGQRAWLSQATSHHIQTVLRMRVGDELVLFNPTQGEWHGVIVESKKKAIAVLIGQNNLVNRESDLRLTLVQALCSHHKMDWIVQKATELGVQAIWLFPAERSTHRGHQSHKKLGHWQAVAASAVAQCGRHQFPEIRYFNTLSSLLSETDGPMDKWVCRIVTSPLSQPTYSQQRSSLVAVGPEGGWTEQEHLCFEEAGFQPLALGMRTLRAETAAISALTVLQWVYGDLAQMNGWADPRA